MKKWKRDASLLFAPLRTNPKPFFPLDSTATRGSKNAPCVLWHVEDEETVNFLQTLQGFRALKITI